MIKVELLNADNLIKRFSNLKQRVQQEAVKSITRLCIEAVAKIKTQKLSGQKLKVKTGRLRRSISYKVEQNGDILTGKIGTAVKYAAVHEYGFNGTVSVRQHYRNIRQAFGRPIQSTNVFVRPFNRKINVPENSFLRSTLNEMQGTITQELQAMVQRVLK